MKLHKFQSNAISKIQDGAKIQMDHNIGKTLQPNQDECFFCKKPFTSDDFKLDKIEKTKSFIAHKVCVDQAITKYWLKVAQNPAHD